MHRSRVELRHSLTFLKHRTQPVVNEHLDQILERDVHPLIAALDPSHSHNPPSEKTWRRLQVIRKTAYSIKDNPGDSLPPGHLEHLLPFLISRQPEPFFHRITSPQPGPEQR